MLDYNRNYKYAFLTEGLTYTPRTFLQLLDKTIHLIITSSEYRKWLKSKEELRNRDIPGYYLLGHRTKITDEQRIRSNIYYKERQRKIRLSKKSKLNRLVRDNLYGLN